MVGWEAEWAVGEDEEAWVDMEDMEEEVEDGEEEVEDGVEEEDVSIMHFIPVTIAIFSA